MHVCIAMHAEITQIKFEIEVECRKRGMFRGEVSCIAYILMGIANFYNIIKA